MVVSRLLRAQETRLFDTMEMAPYHEVTAFDSRDCTPMESIHIRQTVRPVRFAFLVERGDFDALLRAVSLNTVLWGGMYNPIIGLLPEEERKGLIRCFDPDFLVHLSGPLDAGFKERFQFRIVEPDSLVTQDPTSGRPYLQLGLHIGPLLEKLHREEVRFLQQLSVATVVGTDEPAWSRLAPVVYGSFAHLPAQDIDFRHMFVDSLRAGEANVNRTDLPANVVDSISPIEVTRYAVNVYGGQANFSSHILYVGSPESWDDLVGFWNIRATGRQVVFLPLEDHTVFEPLVRRAIQPGDPAANPPFRNHSDIQKAPSVKPEAFEAVANWVISLNQGPVAQRTWAPRYGLEFDWYVGDIRAARLESTSVEEVALWDGNRLTPIKAAHPTFLAENLGARRRDFRWAIELAMRGASFDNSISFSFPTEPGIEKLVHQAATGMPGEVRISNHGLVLTEGFPSGHHYLSPLRTEEMFAAIFEARGFETEISQPGRYAAEIISKMGSLHFDCRMFKVKGVREIITRLSNGSTLTKGNMHDIVTRAWQADANEELYIRRGQGENSVLPPSSMNCWRSASSVPASR